VLAEEKRMWSSDFRLGLIYILYENSGGSVTDVMRAIHFPVLSTKGKTNISNSKARKICLIYQFSTFEQAFAMRKMLCIETIISFHWAALSPWVSSLFPSRLLRLSNLYFDPYNVQTLSKEPTMGKEVW